MYLSARGLVWNARFQVRAAMVLDVFTPVNAPCEELSCARAGRSCV